MTYLNNEEIDALKNIHPKKRYLRYIFLITGISIICIGLFFLFTVYDFQVSLAGINISLVISIFIILFGGIITSKYFIAPYYLRENSTTIKRTRDMREPVDQIVRFNSFAVSRIIAAIILLISGIISLLVFGTDVGHEVKYGSAIFLGGPSWFYVTGLPMLIIGLSLFLYFILSPFRGIFSKSQNFMFFYEIRPGFAWLTEIPIKDIEAIRYQNNHIGPKLTWIILILPFIVQQMMTGIPLFGAERASPDFVLSWTFLLLSILDSIALIILVFFPQNYFEIATADRLYEMWFSPVKLKNQSEFKDEFSTYLDCKPNIRGVENVFANVSTTNFQLFRLIFGLFLIISAIIMFTEMVLFGPMVWWIALMYGLMLIVKSIFFDFSKKEGDTFQYDSEKKVFLSSRFSKDKFQYISAKNVNSIKVKKWFRKLDFFDLFGFVLLLIFTTIQQFHGWLLTDTIDLVFTNSLSTIFMIVLDLFILFYLCFPIDVIEFKTETITYRLEVSVKKELSIISQYFGNLRDGFKELRKSEMKKTLLLRVGIYFAIILGAIIYMLVYLFTIY